MISEDKLTSMIAWFEADGPKPSGVAVTRADMAQALRELQGTRDINYIALKRIATGRHSDLMCWQIAKEALAQSDLASGSKPYDMLEDLKAKMLARSAPSGSVTE